MCNSKRRDAKGTNANFAYVACVPHSPLHCWRCRLATSEVDEGDTLTLAATPTSYFVIVVIRFCHPKQQQSNKRKTQERTANRESTESIRIGCSHQSVETLNIHAINRLIRDPEKRLCFRSLRDIHITTYLNIEYVACYHRSCPNASIRANQIHT